MPCCPTNLVRFLPAVGGMMFATAGNDLYMDQYIPSVSAIPLEGGGLTLTVVTGYPWDGRVELTVDSCPAGARLLLRRPGWCENWTLTVNGRELSPELIKGYLPVSLSSGDRVMLTLDMPVVRVHADPRVKEDAGRVAVMRGPVVYCAEEADNPGIPTEYFHADFALPRTEALVPMAEPALLGGVTTLKGEHVRLIPYYAWDNRAPGGMAVWMKEI